MEKKALIEMIENLTPRSYWGKGVKAYALDLLEELEQDDLPESGAELEKALLYGASNWKEYSDGGCALIYNYEIASRLCSPRELERTKHGVKQPNAKENWLDVQANALRQAYFLIEKTTRGLKDGK